MSSGPSGPKEPKEPKEPKKVPKKVPNPLGKYKPGDCVTIKIDGEDSNIQWSSQDEDERLIWNTLYDQLENAYGGWEIDDGSAGTIELNNNLEIVISHEWNMREMVDCDDRYEITEDDLEE